MCSLIEWHITHLAPRQRQSVYACSWVQISSITPLRSRFMASVSSNLPLSRETFVQVLATLGSNKGGKSKTPAPAIKSYQRAERTGTGSVIPCQQAGDRVLGTSAGSRATLSGWPGENYPFVTHIFTSSFEELWLLAE